MLKRWLLLSVLVLSGCSSDSSDTAVPEVEKPVEAPTNSTPEETQEGETGLSIGTNESVAQELNAPWSIARTEDRWLISERGGTIAVIESDGTIDRQPVDLTENVLEIGEGGLLGIALPDDFETSQELYAYHTYGTPDNVRNRIVQLTWNEGRFKETEVVLDDIPGAQFHNGGRLLLEDDVLWVTTGDASIPELAQDDSSLAGKILRVPLSGEGDPGDWIYSTGHRNPQGLAKVDDMFYASEHGATGHDEVNVIEEGKNYGWPIIEGTQKESGLETPWFEVGETSWAPSGIVADEQYVYMATLRDNRVVAIDRESKEVTPLIEDQGRIRDVWLEDDRLYYITNNTDGRGNPSQDDDQLMMLELK